MFNPHIATIQTEIVGYQLLQFFEFPVGGYVFDGPGWCRNGDDPVDLFFVGLIGVAAVVAGTTYTKVIVTGDGRNFSFTDFLDDFVGLNVVTDQVPQAIKGVRFLLVDAGKKGFEGGKVGVYV